MWSSMFFILNWVLGCIIGRSSVNNFLSDQIFLYGVIILFWLCLPRASH